MNISFYDLPNGGFLEYCIKTNNEIHITGYNFYTDIEHLVIPSTIDGKPVSSIADNAFEECQELKSIVFPEKLFSIGSQSFWGCENLEQIILPQNIHYIDSCAFENCTNLSNIKMPEKIDEFYHHVFNDTKAQKISEKENDGVFYIDKYLISANPDKIPEHYSIKSGTQVILSYAFENCRNLKSLIMPKSVTQLYWHLFEGCASLNSIKIRSPNPRFFSGLDNPFYDLRNFDKNLIVSCHPKSALYKTLPESVARPLQSQMLEKILESKNISFSIGENQNDELEI